MDFNSYDFIESEGFIKPRHDYSVTISSSDNIIKIDEQGALIAEVRLAYDSTSRVLSLFGKDDANLGDMEFPNFIKDINKFEYNDETKEIVLIAEKDNGETVEFSLDIQDLVDVYNAGEGISIDENRTISIKIKDAENSALHVDEEGLSIDLNNVSEQLQGVVGDVEANKTAIETLQGVVGELGNADTSLSEMVTDLEERVGTALSGMTTSLSEAIVKNSEDITTIQGLIDETNSALEVKAEEIYSKIEEVETVLNETNESIDQEFEQININFTNLSTDITTVNDKCNALKDSQDEANETIAELGENLLASATSLSSSIEVVSQGLETANDAISINASNIEGLQTSLSETQDDVEQNKVDIEAIAEDTNALKEGIASALTDYINSQVSLFGVSAQVDLGSNEAVIGAIEGTVSTLNEKIEENTASINSVSERLTNALADTQQSVVNTNTSLNGVKTELEGKIAEVESSIPTEIAKIVNNAPEAFDTLKEVADWIATHGVDAATMNSMIQDNISSITAEVNRATIEEGNIRQSILEKEVALTNRINDVNSSLTASITSETSSRTANDIALGQRITELSQKVFYVDGVSGATAMKEALESAIATEISTRQAEDERIISEEINPIMPQVSAIQASLQSQINAEIEDRNTEDDNIRRDFALADREIYSSATSHTYTELLPISNQVANLQSSLASVSATTSENNTLLHNMFSGIAENAIGVIKSLMDRVAALESKVAKLEAAHGLDISAITSSYTEAINAAKAEAIAEASGFTIAEVSQLRSDAQLAYQPVGNYVTTSDMEGKGYAVNSSITDWITTTYVTRATADEIYAAKNEPLYAVPEEYATKVYVTDAVNSLGTSVTHEFTHYTKTVDAATMYQEKGSYVTPSELNAAKADMSSYTNTAIALGVEQHTTTVNGMIASATANLVNETRLSENKNFILSEVTARGYATTSELVNAISDVRSDITTNYQTSAITEEHIAAAKMAAMNASASKVEFDHYKTEVANSYASKEFAETTYAKKTEVAALETTLANTTALANENKGKIVDLRADVTTLQAKHNITAQDVLNGTE